ncbi:hypothetical protein SERLADRAFT_436189 [Serpula lacrymans var. lacrymans S7.9]|uniref:Uncharacterized protein n=1 Tax=Serpula lacrymans var. lacrymans (strain S7.9) TaxID=578457 RepID=F8NS13_SERL9|nr:uncharacterized protein SERLADRAFT_436189 [Serpula lacrymans var. lacrymans S7.9]EGO26375.1 hypothetical protein SERLADRAFT_436189 [Serpula lacrymans var. lacrymans S7.9]
MSFTQFLCFLVFHIWSYDRFNCLKWNSGRQPGAFKRVMTSTLFSHTQYSYLATLPLLVIFSIAFTIIKYKEGYVIAPHGQIIPKPTEFYDKVNERWILPLYFVFSIAWAFELVVAILGMPLTTLVSRRNLDMCQAWIFLVGSSASTSTTLLFLYVLARFPLFVRRIKDDGAEPDVVIRLVMFYQLNLGRVIFRFLFTLPLFVLALDGVQGNHNVNRNSFWSDFLLAMGGIGCFVSSAITLLIFFPRSLTHELGYTAKAQPQEEVIKASSAALDNAPPPSLHHRHTPSSPKATPHSAPLTPDQPMPISRSPSLSSEDPHEATPEYELEDPHSYDEHPHVRMWNLHDAAVQEIPYSETPYVFDHQSRGWVSRAQQEGNASPSNLHPYVRTFTSPIDLVDLEEDERRHMHRA